MPMPIPSIVTRAGQSWKTRADGFAQPDLARPLRHGHEHDVHYADPTDDQAYPRDQTQEDREQAGDTAKRIQDLLGRDDHEIFVANKLDVVAVGQQLLDLGF